MYDFKVQHVLSINLHDCMSICNLKKMKMESAMYLILYDCNVFMECAEYIFTCRTVTQIEQ